MEGNPKLNFEDTANAFSHKSKSDLKKAYWLFYPLKFPWLTKFGTSFIRFAFTLRLPIKGLIKKTLFSHFCGGEFINDCDKTINELASENIGTILDYSVEGENSENAFISTKEEIIRTINKAKGNKSIPFSVFKITGVAEFTLLQKVQDKKVLSTSEEKEFEAAKNRVNAICETAFESDVRLLIDAEETWIQDTIDVIVTEMMAKYNKEKSIIYNTIQFYRKNAFEMLEIAHQDAIVNQYKYSVKMVRGAYMEKERERAIEMNYESPIHIAKLNTDACYDKGLKYCIDNKTSISLVAGTHNENSSQYLAENVSLSEPNIFFAQLYGMSDHISYTLSKAGYNVSKYVPYGPVKSVLPYLFRRAEENTSIAGQTGRELALIQKELKRRKAKD